MEKLNAERILSIIKEHYTEESFAFEYWDTLKSDFKLSDEKQKLVDEVKVAKGDYWSLKRAYILQELGLGEIELVDSYGGVDCGRTWFRVFKFKDHDGILIRIDGDYQSYSGVEFYNGYGREVVKQEKIIIVYE